MQDVLDRQVKVFVVVGQAGQAAGGDGDAMVALDPRDDLLLLGPAAGIVVVPDQLDRGVVRLRAGAGVKDLRHLAGRHGQQALGQLDRGLVALVREGVIEGEPLHLRASGLDQARLSEADRDRPEASQAFDVLLARIVVDVDAFPFADHHGALVLVLAGVGVGVEVDRHVTKSGGVWAIDHDEGASWAEYRKSFLAYRSRSVGSKGRKVLGSLRRRR